MTPWWTPWVAAYAAIVATVGIVWNVIRSRAERKIALGVEVVGALDDGKRVLHISITNLSEKRDVQVDMLALTFERSLRPDLVTPDGLPLRLQPAQSEIVDYPESKLRPTLRFSTLVSVSVVDSHGAQHAPAHFSVSELRRDFLIAADTVD